MKAVLLRPLLRGLHAAVLTLMPRPGPDADDHHARRVARRHAALHVRFPRPSRPRPGRARGHGQRHSRSTARCMASELANPVDRALVVYDYNAQPGRISRKAISTRRCRTTSAPNSTTATPSWTPSWQSNSTPRARTSGSTSPRRSRCTHHAQRRDARRGLRSTPRNARRQPTSPGCTQTAAINSNREAFEGPAVGTILRVRDFDGSCCSMPLIFHRPCRPEIVPPTPAALGYRMPAEWEPHAATWLSWPRPDGISFPGGGYVEAPCPRW